MDNNVDTKGLIITFTGNGKGKTTAALGMGLRALGQGMKVIVLQFIKGSWEYGELMMVERLGPDFVIKQMGLGFVRNLTEEQKEQHKQAAREALESAGQLLASDKYQMVILDEVFYGIKYGFFTVQDLVQLIQHKPPKLHLVLTGRDAPEEIIVLSDLVTEMKEIKHPYKNGITAQKGVEF